MKVVERRRGGGSLEVSTVARIIDPNTQRGRYPAGGRAEEDPIIQGCILK